MTPEVFYLSGHVKNVTPEVFYLKVEVKNVSLNIFHVSGHVKNVSFEVFYLNLLLLYLSGDPKRWIHGTKNKRGRFGPRLYSSPRS